MKLPIAEKKIEKTIEIYNLRELDIHAKVIYLALPPKFKFVSFLIIKKFAIIHRGWIKKFFYFIKSFLAV